MPSNPSKLGELACWGCAIEGEAGSRGKWNRWRPSRPAQLAVLQDSSVASGEGPAWHVEAGVGRSRRKLWELDRDGIAPSLGGGGGGARRSWRPGSGAESEHGVRSGGASTREMGLGAVGQGGEFVGGDGGLVGVPSSPEQNEPEITANLGGRGPGESQEWRRGSLAS